MNTPAISIIMPVYNAQDTVAYMIDSIIAQTFVDWELICINDGSVDNSKRIIENYACKDIRVKLVNKLNGGVSAARQDGVNIAKGEYIIHADSDDWIEHNMLEQLYYRAKADEADVVLCDFFINSDNGQRLNRQKPSNLNAFAILHDLFKNIHGSCWNKLVRRKSLQKYNVTFPVGINHCEDLLTWIQLFQHPEIKISYLPMAFYHYCENENSITRNYTRQTYEMRKSFQKVLMEYLPSNDFEKEIKSTEFGIFNEAFIYGVLTVEEIKCGLRKYNKQILELHSLRWKLGYLFLSIGLIGISHKLIHY